MAKLYTAILTIQKFVCLLDEFHYQEFRQHLIDNKATLPLKLTETIRKKLPDFDKHEDLCRKVYGGNDKAQRQNFNQLSSYTFRLSAVLSQNYPDYLHQNISLLQKLVNEGKGKRADFLADILLEIAERIGDFQTSIAVLKFLSQEAFLIKDVSTGLKLDARLKEICERESLFFEIQSKLRHSVGVATPPKGPGELDRLLEYYAQFNDDADMSIRILSQYAYLNTLYNYLPDVFEKKATALKIEALERDLNNYPYMVFPFMSDIPGALTFLKLNSPLSDLNSKESLKDFEELSKHYDSLRYWKNYVNVGQIHLMLIQCSRLLSKYQAQIHKNDYRQLPLESDWKQITELTVRCRNFLNSQLGEEYGYDS